MSPTSTTKESGAKLVSPYLILSLTSENSTLTNEVIYSWCQTGQALKHEKQLKDEEEKLHQDFAQFLSALEQHPDWLQHPRLQYLREFISIVDRFPRIYVNGDDTVRMPLPPEDRELEPTRGYVKSVANLSNDESETEDHPILSVLAVNSFHRKDESTIPDQTQNVKFTEVKLVDGDGQKIHARLNRNLVEVGHVLKRGDKIRLDCFTPIRYRINASSPRMPMLFIHNLSRVGSEPLEDEDIEPKMMACTSMLTPREPLDEFECLEDYYIIDPRVHPKPKCTNEERCCAMYGLRFITCVCDAIPVSSLDLETIKADCYFATKDFDKMEPNHKRNMVYWWYATNVYSIVGKGNVQRLPLCLEYAIREKWPNTDGKPYKGNKKLVTKKRKS